VLGLMVALVLAYAMYKMGTKLNLGKFFRILGLILMFFAAGLLADAVENFEQLGWLKLGSHVMWNSSGLVTESSSLGDILHSLLGYADHPTIMQGIVWLGYIIFSIFMFKQLSRDRAVRRERHEQHATLDGGRGRRRHARQQGIH